MPGPARAGLLIYAMEINRLVQFYESVVGATLKHRTEEIAVLQSPDIQLVIHQAPPAYSENLEVTSPPVRRASALKFFFTVPSIAEASVIARKYGGGIDHEQWQGPGFVVRNGYDPEGNIFHLREAV